MPPKGFAPISEEVSPDLKGLRHHTLGLDLPVFDRLILDLRASLRVLDRGTVGAPTQNAVLLVAHGHNRIGEPNSANDQGNQDGGGDRIVDHSLPVALRFTVSIGVFIDILDR
jgi:hypothetical protein